MSHMISAFWIFLELYFLQFLLQAFFQMKTSKRTYDAVVTISGCAAVAVTVFNFPQFTYTLFYIVFFTLIANFLYNGTCLQHAIAVLIGISIAGALDALMLYGASALLGISLEQLYTKKALYTVLCSLPRFLLVFLGWFLKKIRKANGFHSIQVKWLLLSIMFPIVSFLMMMVVFDMSKSSSDLSYGAIVFSVILVVVNFSTIYLLEQLEQASKDAKESSLLRQEQQLQTEHILALEKNYREQRKTAHDFRNRLQTIYDLLEMNQPDKAKAYVRELQGMQTTRIFLSNSGHAIIDAILNHKSQIAKEQNIDLQIQMNSLTHVNIGTDMLTVLLSNLLDNAIEGCGRVSDERQIILELIAKSDMLWLSIKNTSVPVKVIGNTIPTSKTPKEDHGYGIPRVQHILNQLKAEYAFGYKDGWFTFAAEIPLPD